MTSAVFGNRSSIYVLVNETEYLTEMPVERRRMGAEVRTKSTRRCADNYIKQLNKNILGVRRQY